MEIKNAQALTGPFGRWPSFHDAEVVSVLLDRRGDEGPTLTAEILVFGTGQTDERGSRAKGTEVLATLRFSSVELHDLVEFNRQNVLFSLELSELEPKGGGRRYRVDMNPSYGCGASFECRAVEVVSVDPPDEP
ncbi:hypothetical protein GBA65_05335 [Rubrobacter marinus]|uniref:Uncharacterized protein n=1 Tax=Rubrobacter marinus TaxID=2653852 RepID=A0A6G8PV17_9ACTN|nr:Imm50 family immunity protein [Rubrobacter marinus]QIN78034.1 hypothetical protein GBA65_05335 [Rubrobacter marinus]